MFNQEELCERIQRLQEKRDNIIYALVHEEADEREHGATRNAALSRGG